MKLDKKNVVFLLGGHDLEMQEIKSVLEREEIAFYDKELSWNNANLSAYKDKLNKYTTYYAIELTIDLTGYDNVHIIDHHDKLSNNDASLLQVLQLLDKKPTCYQELVAANDARYFKGMKCLKATRSDIASIRQLDKKAQGIKDKDEYQGRKDAQNVITKNGINCVEAKTKYFSTITDSLYFDCEDCTDKTIVYNENKIVFYGFDSEILKTKFHTYGLKEENYYYGGGDIGYMGVNNGELSKDEIIQLKDDVIKDAENKEEPLYSSHIFMFPFRFDYAHEAIVKNGNIHEYEFYYDNDIEKRINLNEIEDKLAKEDWHYEEYHTDSTPDEMHLAYNEFAYFYDYAKDALYNREDFNKDSISSFFRKSKKSKDDKGKDCIEDYYKDQKYTIAIQEMGCKKQQEYNLDISGVSLRIFHTGIAILSIELDNHDYPDFDDILRINDFGRRVYPQYIGDNKTNRTAPTKQSFLPEYIKIGNDSAEDFNTFEYKDIEIGKHIMQILGENLFADKKSLTKDNATYDKFYIQPSLDDRMYVMSWYGNNELIKGLVQKDTYHDSNAWYEYVFVDGNGATVQNANMKHDLLQESTYDRWSNYNALFGITRYSFVALTDTGFGKSTIAKHMNTMYFQMATLLLANRTSILRFSDEIAALVSPTKKQQDKNSIEKHASKLSNLYDIYLKYYNRLYFKEVTHQDQGIELYDIGIRQMRIGNHVEKLDGKFEKLFNVANLKASSKSSEQMNQLNVLAAIFLPLGFMATALGLDIFNYTNVPQIGAWVFSVILLSGIAGYGYVKLTKYAIKNSFLWIVLFSIILSVLGIVLYGHTDHYSQKSQIITQSSQHKGGENVRKHK